MARQENIFTNLGTAFKKELQSVVQQVLVKNGVKNNSQLASSIEFTDNNRSDSLFMMVNDYYKYVSTGRKPNVKKIPIYSLIQFIKRNNIRSTRYSTNQLAFAMQRTIYKNGIRGKNFIQQVQDNVTDIVELRVADHLEELVADSLYAAFKVV